MKLPEFKWPFMLRSTHEKAQKESEAEIQRLNTTLVAVEPLVEVPEKPAGIIINNIANGTK